MENKRKWRFGVLGCGVLLVCCAPLVAGCYHYYYTDPPGPVIGQPPPPPLQEEIPPSPAEDMVWVSGYWHWSGVRYVWIGGRYLHPPGVGVYWYPGGYVRTARGYVYVSGRWAGRRYRARYHGRYVHRRYYGPGRRYHPHYYGHYRRSRRGRSRRFAPKPGPRRRRAPPAR